MILIQTTIHLEIIRAQSIHILYFRCRISFGLCVYGKDGWHIGVIYRQANITRCDDVFHLAF